MEKKCILKKILSLLIVSSLVVLILPAVSSCTPELTFGDVTVCEEIDSETSAPVNPKNDFEIEVKKICAAIEISGVNAEDNWNFKWKNKDTGEIIADLGDKYSKEEEGYLEGFCSSELVPKGEENIIAEPGNYVIEFYHNGELKGSADLKIKTPEVKIIDVTLANEVSESYEPVNPTEQFNPTDIFHACVKMNYMIEGNVLNAKWYSDEDQLLDETQFDITENYYGPSYIDFSFPNENLWPSGDYRVEIYLNKSLNGKYDFEVVEAEVAFGNEYASDEYKFSINYPDGWAATEGEIDNGIQIDFSPASDDMNIGMSMIISNEEYSKDQSSELADEISGEVTSSNNWQQVNKTESDLQLGEVSYNEVFYEYEDSENNSWGMALSFIAQNNKLYLFMGLADADSGDLAEVVYYGMLETLTFK